MATTPVATARWEGSLLAEDDFLAAAEDATVNCTVSKALAGTTITLDAGLAS